MITVYNQQGGYIGHANSIRGACLLSHENRRTITGRINNPKLENAYNYYTDDERGCAVRLAYEITQLVKSIEYPTQQQLSVLITAKTELMKW